MDALSALSEQLLAEHFDAQTLARGREYAAAGAVGPTRVTRTSQIAVQVGAQVQGTAPVPYEVSLYLEAEPDTAWLFSSCTCPVQARCKHAAAVAVTVRAAGEPKADAAPGVLALRGLVEELAADLHPDDDKLPLALEFALEQARRFGQGPTVRVRPLRRGAKQPWVKAGVDWRELPAAEGRGQVARPHVRALLPLYQALPEATYWSAGVSPSLGDFGEQAVERVAAAAEAGVTLLARPPLRDVDPRREPLPVAVEVVAGESGTRVSVGVILDGRLRSGTDVVPLGDPVHSVAVVDGTTLRLARTDRPLPRAARRLLTGGPVDIPTTAAGELDDLLGPLARLLPVASPDGSVAIPDPPRPVLRVSVTWQSSVRATLRWEWRYAERLFPLRSTDSLALLRDPVAERQIAERVPAGLLGIGEVRDQDALALAVHDLAILRETEGVEVAEVQRPDFREAREAPTLSFTVVDRAGEPGQATGFSDWLDLLVTIDVEGESVPLAEVLAALTLGQEHLVLPSGLYVRTDRPELDRLREVVRSAAELRESDPGRISVGTHDLGVWAELAELGVVDEQASAWVARAQALRDLVEIPRPEPTGLATELRPYQRDGLAWLALLWEHGLGGILADDMGLGKTLQVLALISHAVDRGADGPFLVVAPTSVVTAWLGEAERHTPDLRVATVTSRTDDVEAAAARADIVVTTYTVLRLRQHDFAGRHWAGLVLDEAHQVKNHQSKTYAAARLIEAPFRLAVTGTPLENRLMELWALLSLTVPGLYPWPRSFQTHVAKPVEQEGDERALARFRRRIKPFMLRRTKELVAADLPPKQEQVVAVPLAPRHRRLYDAHLAKERQRILGLVSDFDRNRVAIFSALTKLRQLALDPALVDRAHEAVGSAKTDLLAEQVQELVAEGHRALVFSQFTSYLRRVRERLEAEGVPTAYLDGSTRDRGAVIDAFRAGAAPVFLISLKAGGVGLTLTEADYVFVLDPWWNPAAEAQAVDRAHRIGQESHVLVYRLIAEDTIEDKVMQLKARKAELFAQVVDGDGRAAAGIVAEDIRALFDD